MDWKVSLQFRSVFASAVLQDKANALTQPLNRFIVTFLHFKCLRKRYMILHVVWIHIYGLLKIFSCLTELPICRQGVTQLGDNLN